MISSFYFDRSLTCYSSASTLSKHSYMEMNESRYLNFEVISSLLELVVRASIYSTCRFIK